MTTEFYHGSPRPELPCSFFFFFFFFLDGHLEHCKGVVVIISILAFNRFIKLHLKNKKKAHQTKLMLYLVNDFSTRACEV